MQELQESLENYAKHKSILKEDFTEAAIKWASYALKYHTGEVLTKALQISQALVEFEDATGIIRLNPND